MHDYPSIFQKVVSRAWRKYLQQESGVQSESTSNSSSTASSMSSSQAIKREPKLVMQCKELVVENGLLIEVEPRPAANSTAMVAWRLKLFTPEYPEGREVICIANDITIGMRPILMIVSIA